MNQSVLKNVLMLYCTNAGICNLAVDEMPQISLLLVIENQGNMFQEKNGDFQRFIPFPLEIWFCGEER